jgi:hypothetical protein
MRQSTRSGKPPAIIARWSLHRFSAVGKRSSIAVIGKYARARIDRIAIDAGEFTKNAPGTFLEGVKQRWP